ncbi:3-dehydroquinate dehydratase [Enterococcus florum]|uniref:3-dehydroquinate dehydratase n=1 Tax=Enterococcus florum TaxID=2480627 RepID=A0A4V0WQ11_9ENTE|nr:type I 3-dehydroquinate dehydratase [Enterococcus florum]GCF95739.1 3-dehydroquinate dehydratase [Enterococcus florum]
MMDVQVRNVRFDAGKPKICVPLVGGTREEILDQAEKAKKIADVIEWRADYYDELGDDEQLLVTLLALRDEVRNTPVIFNLRTQRQGGTIDLSLKEYRRLNEFAVTSRAIDLLDIDLGLVDQLSTTFIHWVQALDVKVILSDHHFSETPNDAVLLFRLNMMEHFGADIAKIVVTPENEADVIRLLEMTLRAQTFVTLPTITVSKGRLGKLSRVAGYLDGSCMTYGYLSGLASEEDQIEVETLKRFLDEFS